VPTILTPNTSDSSTAPREQKSKRPGNEGHSRASAQTYRFGAFEVDLGLYALRKKGSAVDIQPKVLDLLVFLITHTERVVSKDEILEAVWSGTAATDDVLNRAIHAARHAVGDDGEKQRVIQTVRGRGFRFVATIERLEPETVEPAPGTPPAAHHGAFPFVGRTEALSQLQSALEDARQGRGRIVFVAGEAGIGKSRLLEEFTRHAAATGVQVASGWCWDGDGAPPYWPWVQVLRALVEALDIEKLRAQMGRGAIDIARILPALREKLPKLAGEAPAHTDQERFQLFDSITRFLRRTTNDDPLIVVLDDLQWADSPSLRLIEFLTREFAGMRLLVVATHHERGLSSGHPILETIGVLARRPAYERIFLDGLSEEEVSRLLESVSDRRPPEKFVRTVHSKTDGNPFLVTEITQLVKDDPSVLEADAGSDGILSLPSGVKAIVQRRLAMVSPPVRQILSLAAVAGQEFSRSMLEQALGSRLQRESLEEAFDSTTLSEIPGSPDRYRFTHALIREALYDDLGVRQRARLHRQVAETLEAMHGLASESSIAEIAFHLTEAATSTATSEELEKAIAFSKRAGRCASEQLAYEEASGHFRDALELFEQRDAQAAGERCRLLIVTAEAERRAGNLARARETLVTAADLARQIQMPELFAQAALGIETPFVWLSGTIDPLEVELLEEALTVTAQDQGPLRVQLLSRLAVALFWSKGIKHPVHLAEQAYEIARQSGDPSLLARSSIALLFVTAKPEMPIDIDLALECVRYAHESGDPELIHESHAIALEWACIAGSASAWEIELPALEEVAEQLREPMARWYAQSATASKLFIEGRLGDAVEASDAARVLMERIQNPTIQYTAPFQFHPLLREQQRLEVCEGEFRRLAGLHRPGSLWACSLAHVLSHLEREDEDEARELFEGIADDQFARVVPDEGWRVSMHLLTELCRDYGSREHAAELYRRLLPHNGQCAVLGFVALHGPVSRDLGILAAMSGQLEEAVAHFEGAIETSRQLGAATWAARIRYDHARALFESGDPTQHDQALTLAQQSLDDANTYELVALRADLGALLQSR
jgi:DNA-binding winged helix-turn-helix (wHTH) protein/tetratricopeptide (TPR) repeat protein